MISFAHCSCTVHTISHTRFLQLVLSSHSSPSFVTRKRSRICPSTYLPYDSNPFHINLSYAPKSNTMIFKGLINSCSKLMSSMTSSLLPYPYPSNSKDSISRTHIYRNKFNTTVEIRKVARMERRELGR